MTALSPMRYYIYVCIAFPGWLPTKVKISALTTQALKFYKKYNRTYVLRNKCHIFVFSKLLLGPNQILRFFQLELDADFLNDRYLRQIQSWGNNSLRKYNRQIIESFNSLLFLYTFVHIKYCTSRILNRLILATLHIIHNVETKTPMIISQSVEIKISKLIFKNQVNVSFPKIN